MSEVLLALEQAAPGMVLALDLTDANGNVLLPEGSTLSAANLASLRRRGVHACCVRAAAPAEPDAGADPARWRQRLDHLFRASASAQATPQLLRLLLDYRRNG